MNTPVTEPLRILLVDDEPQNLRLLHEILEGAPFDYPITQHLAENGLVAYKLAEEVQPDLVITDWEMPAMDGITLLKTLKAHPTLHQSAVLMVTGIYLGAEALHTAFEHGAVDYINKPVQKPELLARVNATLQTLLSARQIQAQHQRILQQTQALKEQKEREVGSKLLELQEKNNTLKALKKELEALHTLPCEQVKGQLVKTIKQLEAATRQSNEWEAFQLQFEQVNPQFLPQLKTTHPKLTKEDLRYCIYLRLNMSTQEIAQLLNIATKSVHQHKFRLKKKLIPNGETSLSDYLMAL